MKRYITDDIISRFKAHKESLRTSKALASETADYCTRIVRDGSNCAIIIGVQDDYQWVYDLVINALNVAELKISSGAGGGILLDNGAQIRILTINTAFHAPLLLGEGVTILHANEGDPRAKKVREVFDL